MKAIGIKLVELNMMTSNEAINHGYHVGDNMHENGYEITYPDGYKSWCPDSVVIKHYYPLLDPNGTMIREEDVDNFIIKGTGLKIGDKTTVVLDTTITGFDTIGTSACVDPVNYNQEIGDAIARKDIKDKIWSHLGFVLQWAKNGLTYNSK